MNNASEVVREGLRLLEQRQPEDKAKVAWLRAATEEAANSIERGEGLEFETMDDLAAHVHRIGEGVSEEIAAERKRG